MTSESRIRVMIVDDHAIVREGIAQVLEQSGEFEVVGQAGDDEEAVGLVRPSYYDLPAKSSQYSMNRPTRLDKIENFYVEVRSGPVAKTLTLPRW